MPANELLHDKDKQFRLLFEDNPLPMWVFDRKTLRFLEVNQAAVAHYGYTRDEFLEMTLVDVRPSGEAARPAQLRLQGSARHRLKDGRIIDVETAAHTISYAGKQAILCVLHDVTARREIEVRLSQAAKMEAVGMLAGGIAHDFNNLLTIINGYSHILLGAIPPTDPNHSAVEQIMRAGERAAALTKQLLAFSRRQAPQPKILDLNQLVNGLDSMLRRLIGEDYDIRFIPDPELGRVNADPGQIEQVVMNLVVNARDAMAGGGLVTIETNNVDFKQDGLPAGLKPGAYVSLIVSDIGSGMDAQTQARMFEPFFTTKEQGKGTGLGLTSVFGIAKQNGGGVEVRSELGQGTSVRVYLPRLDRPVNTEAETSVSAAKPGSETILLVEDEELVRNLVSDALRREGYKVLAASTAAEARRIGDSFQEPIDLLIADVVLPKEGGYDLAESLTPHRPAMKVLFMSGYTEHVNGRATLPAGSFIQKPFTPAALSIKVREILEGNGESTRKARG